MKYYKVSEKTLRWYLKDFLIYNALKKGGLYESWDKAFDVLYDTMWTEDKEYGMTHCDVFNYFKYKANDILKHMEKRGLMEEIK